MNTVQRTTKNTFVSLVPKRALPSLLEDLEAEFVLADTGYDSEPNRKLFVPPISIG